MPTLTTTVNKPHIYDATVIVSGISRGWANKASNAATLPVIARTNNFTILPNSLAPPIMYDEQRAKGIWVADTESKEMSAFYAKNIFCNASALDHRNSTQFTNKALLQENQVNFY
ncbi:hypothetical protein [Spirosoma litoris]